MNFRLEKQSPGKTQTRFFVYDDKDSIVGVITVDNGSVSDLQKHWKDVAPSSPKNAATAAKNPMVAAMLASVRKQGARVNKAAILRGC